MGNSQKKPSSPGIDVCGSLFLTNSVGYIIPHSINNILFQEKQLKIQSKAYQETIEFSQITGIEIVLLSSGGKIIKLNYNTPQHSALLEFVSPDDGILDKIKLMKFELQV